MKAYKCINVLYIYVLYVSVMLQQPLLLRGSGLHILQGILPTVNSDGVL